MKLERSALILVVVTIVTVVLTGSAPRPIAEGGAPLPLAPVSRNDRLRFRRRPGAQADRPNDYDKVLVTSADPLFEELESGFHQQQRGRYRTNGSFDWINARVGGASSRRSTKAGGGADIDRRPLSRGGTSALPIARSTAGVRLARGPSDNRAPPEEPDDGTVVGGVWPANGGGVSGDGKGKTEAQYGVLDAGPCVR